MYKQFGLVSLAQVSNVQTFSLVSLAQVSIIRTNV